MYYKIHTISDKMAQGIISNPILFRDTAFLIFYHWRNFLRKLFHGLGWDKA